MQQLTTIPLDQLHAHPANSNVMPRPLLRKLKAHMKRTKRYPPVLVRRRGEAGGYEILDGHHRVVVLRELKQATAQCIVWDVDDDEALLLLGTLNRLQGDDDPHRRAELVSAMNASGKLQTLAAQLPESAAKLEQLLKLREPAPRPAAAPPTDDMPVSLHVFLSPADRRRVLRVLDAIGPDRGTALVRLCEAHGAAA